MKKLVLLTLLSSLFIFQSCAVLELAGEASAAEAVAGTAAGAEMAATTIGIEGGEFAVQALRAAEISSADLSLAEFRIAQANSSARIFAEVNGQRSYLGRFISENEVEWKTGRSTTFPSGRLYTANRGVNIRSSATTLSNENIIGKLQYQEPVISKGQVGSFTKVVYGEGRIGYVYTDYLSQVRGFNEGGVGQSYGRSTPFIPPMPIYDTARNRRGNTDYNTPRQSPAQKLLLFRTTGRTKHKMAQKCSAV